MLFREGYRSSPSLLLHYSPVQFHPILVDLRAGNLERGRVKEIYRALETLGVRASSFKRQAV